MKTHLCPDILFIVLDCVRPDRMSCYGYHKDTTPNIGLMSKKSTIFENAISAAPWTLPSHASMFTGLYPSEHGATTWDSKLGTNIPTLAKILLNNGYKTAAVCQNDGFINDLTGLSDGFKFFYGWKDIINSNISPKLLKMSKKNLPGSGTLIKFFNFLKKEDITSLSISLCKRILKREKNKPVFLFVNLLAAHFPYDLGFPQYSLKVFFRKTFETWRRTIKRTNLHNDPLMRQYQQMATKKEFTNDEFKKMNDMYDDAIYRMDFQIAKLFHFMEMEKRIDNTLIIITSDHGENIGDHNLISHDLSVHDSLVKVPLIIYFPKLFPNNLRVTNQVETRNIFYTILHILSIPFESRNRIRQNSLLEKIISRNVENYAFGEYTPSHQILSNLSKYSSSLLENETRRRQFIRTKDFKFVKYDNGKEELYSLGFKERKVNPVEYEKTYNQLKKKLEKWKNSLNINNKKNINKKLKDEEENKLKQRLKSLGYF